MFVLRWVIRDSSTECSQATTERVLQFRQALWYMGADGNFHIGRNQTGGPAMSEWQDVPDTPNAELSRHARQRSNDDQ